jgi:predicted RNase H-like nuclease (RuvC/YqgF family)
MENKTLMKYLKTFEKFDVKKENPGLEIGSDMNNFNDSEKWLKDFNARKNAFITIYNTYKDDTNPSDNIPQDLFNKLLSAKFIKQNSDKSKIVFINPLFNIYSELCKKTREVKNITSTLNQKKTDLIEKQKSIKNNDGDTETINKDIQDTNNSIKELSDNLNKINNEINNLKKSSDEQIKKSTKTLKDSKTRIDTLENPPAGN